MFIAPYLPRNKLKRRSKYSITVRFRFISYARYPLLSVCLCVRVCLFVLVVWIYIYIFIYLCCGSRTFTQGQKYKTRYVKKTRLSAGKKLYLYVVAVIMTKFRGYQFNTPHPFMWVSPTPTQICLLHNFSDHNVYCLHKVRVSMFKLFIFEIVNIKQA